MAARTSWERPASPVCRAESSRSRTDGSPCGARQSPSLLLTMKIADRHSLQTADSQTHSSRSAAVSFGRFTDRCRIPSSWRRARISTCRAVQLRNDARRVPNSAKTVSTHGNRKKNGQSSIYQPFRGLRELHSSDAYEIPSPWSTIAEICMLPPPQSSVMMQSGLPNKFL
jgi:hypothetical protein